MLGAALVAIAALAVAITSPGSPLREPSMPPPAPSASQPVPVSSPPSSASSSPTAPPLTEKSPGPASTAPPSATPREQPTENEDSGPRETLTAIAIKSEALPSEGIQARLALIESVDGEAVIPGEAGGPALRITLEVTNATDEPFLAPAVVVNLYTGANLSPAGPVLNPGGTPFPEVIPPGSSARGIYLFTVASKERENVTIEVDLAVGTPVVVFQGDVS